MTTDPKHTGPVNTGEINWRFRLRQALVDSPQSQYATLMVVAAVTGVVAGYAAIGFYLAVSAMIELFYGVSEQVLATGVRSLDWRLVLIIPTLAGLIVGQLTRFLPRQQTHGVPDVIESAALHSGRMSARRGLLSAAATMIAIGGGSSTGREGPVVHLGASLASIVTRALRLNAKFGRTLLGCGVAAAVAASFNAPIAGALFALEVVVGHYALHTLSPIVVAAIAGTLVSHAHLGNFPAFVVVDQHFASFWEFPAFLLLGITSAILAAAFMWSTHRLTAHVGRQNWLPASLRPAVGGLLVGALALWHPEILGVGYEATTRAINSDYALLVLITILGLKFAATILSVSFRFGSGIFSPSLVLGAMLGGAFGLVAGSVFPHLASDPGVYAVVGMGAVASAVLGAPISTILIVFEITGDYSLTVAVMIGVAVSTVVVTFFQPRSYFHQLLVNRGVHLEGGRATYLLRSERVSDHMTRDFFTVHESAKLAKARELLLLQGGGLLIVTDDSGQLVGTLGLDDLAGDHHSDDELVGVCARQADTTLTADAPLQEALEKLDRTGEAALPVVQTYAASMVVGVIRNRDVMKAYNSALLDAQGRGE